MRAYLDYNATAPLRPEIRAAMLEVLDGPANPSSIHAEGRHARHLIDEARGKIARLAGACADQVYFTSGATEANNWALAQAGSRLASSIEHPSVRSVPGATAVPVTASGVLDLPALEEALSRAAAPVLLSCMLVNNETGVIQPVAEAAALMGRQGGWLHCDAVQAAGKLDFNLTDLGASYVTLSSHKLGGPHGIGALVVGPGMIDALRPLIHGGAQEARRRAGTENVAAAVGFGAAADLAEAAIRDQPRLAALRDAMEAELTACAPELVVLGADAPRVGGTSLMALPGLAAETQLIALDMAGVAVGTGAACSSGKIEGSHVVASMRREDLARCAIRVSLGWNTTADDLAKFTGSWQELYRRHRGRSAQRA